MAASQPGTGTPSHIGPVPPDIREELRGNLKHRVHGVFPSAKNARSIPWARREQRDLMFLLELDPTVVSYDAMDEQVSLVLGGVPKTHRPAFRIQTSRGPAVVDAVTTRWATSHNGIRLLAAVSDAYAGRGIPYRAIADRDLRLEPRASNARWALARKAHARDPRTELHIVAALSDGPRRLHELVATLHGVADVRAAACLMAVHRCVALDLGADLPERMSVTLCTGAVR